MTYIKKELTGIFYIDNTFVYDTITKTVEYDDTKEGAKVNANSMLLKWKEECFVYEFESYYGIEKNLFGGRVFIKGKKQSYQNYIQIDGIYLKKINGNDYFGFNSEFTYSEIVHFLNDIAVYGVDGFLEKYIAHFMEHFPLIEQQVESYVQNWYKLINETNNEKQKASYIEAIAITKKNFRSYLSTRYYLALWRPLGKTNEQMLEAVNKLRENLVCL